MALGLRLDGRPDRVATREELMQAERKNGEPARCAAPHPFVGTFKQKSSQHIRAPRGIGRRQVRKFSRCAFLVLESLALKPTRNLPDKPTGSLLGTHTEGGFDPR